MNAALVLHSINWSDPKSLVTDHFTVHEATFLSTWGIYHTPSDAEKAALQQTCVTMERIRGLVGNRSITINCMVRPNKVNCPESVHHGQDYNAAIGSVAKHSPHILGMACDFSVPGLSCDVVRALLLPHLDELNIRMENIPGALWVHIDGYSPNVSGGRRFFTP